MLLVPVLLNSEDGEWQRRCRCGVEPHQRPWGPSQRTVAAVAVGTGQPEVVSALVAHEHSWWCREQLSALVTHPWVQWPPPGGEQGLVVQKSSSVVFPRFSLQSLLLAVFLAQRHTQGLAEALASFLM